MAGARVSTKPLAPGTRVKHEKENWFGFVLEEENRTGLKPGEFRVRSDGGYRGIYTQQDVRAVYEFYATRSAGKPVITWHSNARGGGGEPVGPAYVDGNHDGNCMSETEARAFAESIGATFKKKPSKLKPRKSRKKPADLGSSVHITIRKCDVLCTICGEIEPVNPGHGTPMPTFIVALEGVLRRHPAKPHVPMRDR